MALKTISSYEELKALVGQELGTSDWHQVTQEQINKFADATLDHQWIHVDEAKAAAESPFKSTIAHGYLTISLLPYLWGQIVEVKNFKMQVKLASEGEKKPAYEGNVVFLYHFNK